MSAEVVWQVIKKNNSFLRKGSAGRHDAVFSAEPGNLYARHSFKHSGLANAKTIDITDAGEAAGLRVKVTKTSAKKGNKPAKRAAVETVKALSGRKLIAAVAAEAGKYRPDLKDAAIRRASAIQKSLRVKKAAGKSTGSQALTVA